MTTENSFVDKSPTTFDRWLLTLVKLVWGSVIAVVLFAVLWPRGFGRRPSSGPGGLSNIKQVVLGMIMYANDYDDRLPPAMSANQDIRRYGIPYLKNEYVFKSVNPAGGQIMGNGVLAGKKMGDIVDPASIVMLYDSRPWRGDYALVGYADGHAKSSSPFEAMLQQLTVDPFSGKKASHG